MAVSLPDLEQCPINNALDQHIGDSLVGPKRHVIGGDIQVSVLIRAMRQPPVRGATEGVRKADGLENCLGVLALRAVVLSDGAYDRLVEAAARPTQVIRLDSVLSGEKLVSEARRLGIDGVPFGMPDVFQHAVVAELRVPPRGIRLAQIDVSVGEIAGRDRGLHDFQVFRCGFKGTAASGKAVCAILSVRSGRLHCRAIPNQQAPALGGQGLAGGPLALGDPGSGRAVEDCNVSVRAHPRRFKPQEFAVAQKGGDGRVLIPPHYLRPPALLLVRSTILYVSPGDAVGGRGFPLTDVTSVERTPPRGPTTWYWPENGVAWPGL